MSKSQIVTQDLPYLRRYARALTGSQTSGDAYVTAIITAGAVRELQLKKGDAAAALIKSTDVMIERLDDLP